MLKKTIMYTDYNGVERAEDFYFNLTRAEVLEMDLSVKGGMAGMLERIVQTKDVPALISSFKEIICKSYGVKSPDGKRFMKNPEILAEFVETEAYTELFMELATDEQAALDFINGIIPKISDPD